MDETCRFPIPFPPPFASAWGDDAFGLWAEFTLSTEHGSATQRLRWIELGTFLMGSPEDEPERQDREGRRHLVTLTQGFWLADSACTQALWLAVMGNNPSYFKDNPDNPVETVSWNDVQPFLRKLEKRLSGGEATLPTEAEWEYACRAGTDTPFSFGAQITPEQVNYDGNYPYAGGEKGQYRGKAVPVKSLPPNGWGLYEMHGNVWEWCADGQRDYDGQPQQDPLGPIAQKGAETPPAVRNAIELTINEVGEAKLALPVKASLDTPNLNSTVLPAVRGGAWSYGAEWARSACRNAYPPGDANRSLGFRLCLRSIKPG